MINAASSLLLYSSSFEFHFDFGVFSFMVLDDLSVFDEEYLKKLLLCYQHRLFE